MSHKLDEYDALFALVAVPILAFMGWLLAMQVIPLYASPDDSMGYLYLSNLMTFALPFLFGFFSLAFFPPMKHRKKLLAALVGLSVMAALAYGAVTAPSGTPMFADSVPQYSCQQNVVINGTTYSSRCDYVGSLSMFDWTSVSYLVGAAIWAFGVVSLFSVEALTSMKLRFRQLLETKAAFSLCYAGLLTSILLFKWPVFSYRYLPSVCTIVSPPLDSPCYGLSSLSVFADVAFWFAVVFSVSLALTMLLRRRSGAALSSSIPGQKA